MGRHKVNIEGDYEKAVIEAPDGVQGVGSTLQHFWIRCSNCDKQSLSLSWFEKVLEANQHLYPKLFEYSIVKSLDTFPPALENYLSRERSIKIWVELRNMQYSKLFFHCPFCNYEKSYPFTRYELDREFIMIYYGNKNLYQ